MPHRPLSLAVCVVVAMMHHSNSLGQDKVKAPEGQSQLELAATTFIQQLDKGDFEGATKGFDATMSAALQPLQLQAIWTSLTQSAGEFDQTTQVRHESVDVYQIVFVTCKFARASLDAKVVFNVQGQIAGLFFIPTAAQREYTDPEYVRGDAYREEDISIGSPDWKLPGTLSLPRSDSKTPAVILVHGSGPNDRDETIGANKPFRDLAGGLATKGIAVLRYDKRTKIHGDKLSNDLTVQQETVDDVLIAAKYLTQQSSIDSTRIIVLGHSMGGYLIPRIAKADTDELIAGYVSLAGNTRPIEDLVLEQTTYILQLDGELSATDDEAIKEIKRLVGQIKSIAKDPKSTFVMGAPAKYWQDLDGYLPHQEAQLIIKPMLILQGERDYQVTMQDFANWQTALSQRRNVQLKSYRDLNHLMMSGTGASTPAEYDAPGHVAEEVIEDLVSWIKAI